ncbi:hypothetical protein A3752_08420 [Oleiphilus sp. HI0081]|nr:hypothetical protein A3752_08420 [Oleiphilus sp. HI0081]
MVVAFFFCICNLSTLQLMLKNKYIFMMSVALLIYPVAVSVLNYGVFFEAFDSRSNAERLLGIVLFISSSIYGMKVSVSRAKRLIICSVVVTIFGIILSLLLPQIFLFALEAVNAKSVLSGRGFGFYLQPNSVAMALCFLFGSYVVVCRDHKVHKVAVAVLLSLLLTASRAGLLCFLFFFLLVYLRGERFLTVPGFIKTIPKLAVFASGGVLLLILAISIYSSYAPSNSEFSGVDRLNSMFNLEFDQTNKHKGSGAGDRINAIIEFSEAIYERPVGYGLGVVADYKEKGRFTFSSHNQYLLVGFEAGVLGMFLYIILIYRLKNICITRIGRIYTSSFAYLVLLYGLFINNILSLRVSLFCIGLIFGVYYQRKLRQTCKLQKVPV